MGERWMTFERASEVTGFGVPFFLEHASDGIWAEGRVWKWVLGRKVVDLQALYAWIDQQPSIPSNRGRRRATDPSSTKCERAKQPEPA